MPAGPGARVVRERYALAQANWARFSLVCLSQRSRSLFARGGGAADLSERRARGFPGGLRLQRQRREGRRAPEAEEGAGDFSGAVTEEHQRPRLRRESGRGARVDHFSGQVRFSYRSTSQARMRR
jgi:hypothetical protein